MSRQDFLESTRSRAVVLGIVFVVIAGTAAAGAVQIGTDDRAAVGDGPPAQEQQVQQQQTGDSGFSGVTNASEAAASLAGDAENDTAGWSVASAGDVNGDGVDDLVVGAPRNDSAGENAGAAYVFYGPVDRAAVNASEANVTLRGAGAYDLAGWSVSTAGDVNNDSVADVVVGAPYNDTDAANAGAAYVIYGNETLPETMNLSEANATLRGTERNAQAGYSVSDVNRTNETDGVAVGAPFADEGGADAGAAYVVDGNESLAGGVDLAADADATFVGEHNGSHAGWSVSSAGDVNNDSVEEVAVGAPRYNATAADGDDALGAEADNFTGAAYVVNGSAGDTVSLGDATATLVGVGDRDNAGWSVSAAGDVNNDSVADVVVGAPFNDSTARDAGAAYVVAGGEDFGGESSLADADVRAVGEAYRDRAGWSVSAAPADAATPESGELTCDAVDDVLVGAPFDDTSARNAGAAYVVAGGESLAGDVNLSDADGKFVGDGAGDRAGYAVAAAGDLDDDGFVDLAVGAPYNDSGNTTSAGAAYVVGNDCEVVTEPETATPDETDTPTETVGAETETPETETPTATETATPTATPTPEQDGFDFVAFCVPSDREQSTNIVIDQVVENSAGDPIEITYLRGGLGGPVDSIVHQAGGTIYEQQETSGTVVAGDGTDVTDERSAGEPCGEGLTAITFDSSELFGGSSGVYTPADETATPNGTDAPTETVGAETETPGTETPADTETPAEDTETAAGTETPAEEPEQGAIDFVAFCFDPDQTESTVIVLTDITENGDGAPTEVNYQEGGHGPSPEAVVHGSSGSLYEASGSPGTVVAGEGSDVSDRSSGSPCADGQDALQFGSGDIYPGSTDRYTPEGDGTGEETETDDGADEETETDDGADEETETDDGADEETETDDGAETDTDDDGDGGAGNAPAGDANALDTMSQSPLFPAPFVALMGLSAAVLATNVRREE